MSETNWNYGTSQIHREKKKKKKKYAEDCFSELILTDGTLTVSFSFTEIIANIRRSQSQNTDVF